MSASASPARRRNRTGGGSAKARRSAARLAAVQALYQIDLGGAPADTVLAEFITHRLGHEIDGASYVAADPPLFTAIVRGVSVRLAEVDAIVVGALSAGLALDRLELLLRAILRAGAWELLANAGTAPRIIISEYVEVARAFFQGRETAVINGVLDQLARRLRPDEMTSAEPAP